MGLEEKVLASPKVVAEERDEARAQARIKAVLQCQLAAQPEHQMAGQFASVTTTRPSDAANRVASSTSAAGALASTPFTPVQDSDPLLHWAERLRVQLFDKPLRADI